MFFAQSFWKVEKDSDAGSYNNREHNQKRQEEKLECRRLAIADEVYHQYNCERDEGEPESDLLPNPSKVYQNNYDDVN